MSAATSALSPSVRVVGGGESVLGAAGGAPLGGGGIGSNRPVALGPAS